MGRLERRILRLNDRIAALRRQEDLTAQELEFHRHIDDDARRDAAVSGDPIDRDDARQTAGDVARFERALDAMRRERQDLEQKRDRLLERL